MHYPQQVVAHKTGLTPNTLRAWERRYGGIEADRDNQGRRVYSEELTEKLILLSILVDQGYRIGDLANRPNGDLRVLAEALNHSKPAQIIPNPSLERAIRATRFFDHCSLWTELERATSVYGRLELIDSFIFPLLHEAKKFLESQELLGVHLQFLQSTLRTFLSTLLAPILGDPTKPQVVFAYPLGQVCDLGGIASAVHIHAAGWHPVLLGSSIPSEQIIAATRQLNAQAVILSSVTDSYDTRVLNEVVKVRRGLPPEVWVFFGGHVPRLLRDDIVAGGLIPMEDMADLRQQLGNLVSPIS